MSASLVTQVKWPSKEGRKWINKEEKKNQKWLTHNQLSVKSELLVTSEELVANGQKVHLFNVSAVE